MSRLYADAAQHPPFSSGRLRPGPEGVHRVEVLLTPQPAGPVPGQFHWRGRDYVVTEVHSRWTRSGQWWRGGSAYAVATGSATAGTDSSPGDRLDDREQQWWRVEASVSPANRSSSGGPGVYDLCFEVGPATWWLARVLD